jgi:hypothetical protein
MQQHVLLRQRLTKNAILSGVLALAALPATAQNELSNFTATGRGGAVNALATEYQALGVNPANLGRATGVKIGFTIGEFGASMSSRTASRTIFNKFLFNTEDQFNRVPGANRDSEKGKQERADVVKAFTGENAGIVAADATPFAVSFYHPTIGGIAINTRYRMFGSADLNATAADLLFRGDNADVIQQNLPTAANPLGTFPKASAALKGTRIQIQAIQEFNIGYGRKVYEGEGVEISLGLGLKFIRGIGILDVRSDGKTLTGYGALSPVFEADYPATIVSGFNPKTKSSSSAQFPGVGRGSAFDIGISATVAKKVHLSASIIDVGKMTWDANLVEMQDATIKPYTTDPTAASDPELNYPGPVTYNFWRAIKRFQVNGNSENSPFTYKPSKKREVKLPTRLRVGAASDLGDKFTVAIDGQLPFDKEIAGSYRSALVGAGVTYKPVYWLHLSSGVSGGAGFGASIPLGISIVTRTYEGGFATRDIMGYFGEDNPYLSVVAGFLRFKLGVPENPE